MLNLNDFESTPTEKWLFMSWWQFLTQLYFFSIRIWWQQSQLYILRTLDKVPSAQPVWGPHDGPLGPLFHRGLFCVGFGLFERFGSYHRSWQWPGYLSGPRAGVQRWESYSYSSRVVSVVKFQSLIFLRNGLGYNISQSWCAFIQLQQNRVYNAKALDDLLLIKLLFKWIITLFR